MYLISETQGLGEAICVAYINSLGADKLDREAEKVPYCEDINWNIAVTIIPDVDFYVAIPYIVKLSLHLFYWIPHSRTLSTQKFELLLRVVSRTLLMKMRTMSKMTRWSSARGSGLAAIRKFCISH